MDSASGPASPVLAGYGRSVGSLGPGLTSDSADAVRAVLRDDLSAPVQEGTSRMEERPAWMRDGAKALLLEGAVTYRSSASRSTRTTYGGWPAHAQASRYARRSQPSWQPRTTIPATGNAIAVWDGSGSAPLGRWQAASSPRRSLGVAWPHSTPYGGAAQVC